MAEIALIPVDAEAVEPESPSASSALPEEAVPAKRGRGRPPGAKNKARVETDPEPPPAITLPPVITLTPVPAATPKKRKAPPPPEEDTEEEETPPPRKPRKRQKTEIIQEPLPTSPRSRRVRCHVESQARRRDAHAERVQSFSSMLDKMVAY
jgi:hypothetical protein